MRGDTKNVKNSDQTADNSYLHTKVQHSHQTYNKFSFKHVKNVIT